MNDLANVNAAAVLQHLALHHTGHEHGITCEALAFRLGISERDVRTLVTELRQDGHAVCAHPATGYFLARDEFELQTTIRFLTDRALKSLLIAAQLKRMPLADLVGQLKLPT